MKKTSLNKTFVFVTLLLILGVMNFVFSGSRNTLFKMFSSIQKFLWIQTGVIDKTTDYIFHCKSLQAEKEMLYRENLFLKQKLAQNRFLYQENLDLRQALGLKTKQKGLQIVSEATIVSLKAPGTVLIDKGWKQGVGLGLPFVNREGVLIGMVKKTFRDFSLVHLLTYPEMKFSVALVDPKGDIEERILGVAQAINNELLEIGFLPKDKNIPEGEVVVTSGVDEKFPQGLLVGRVVSVENKPLEPFQKCLVKPYFTHDIGERGFLIERFSPNDSRANEK